MCWMQTGPQDKAHGSGPPTPSRSMEGCLPGCVTLISITDSGFKSVTVNNGKLIDILNGEDSGVMEGRGDTVNWQILGWRSM